MKGWRRGSMQMALKENFLYKFSSFIYVKRGRNGGDGENFCTFHLLTDLSEIQRQMAKWKTCVLGNWEKATG